MRKNNTQQWREDVFPKLDNLRKAITDYQRGLTDYTEEELEQIAHDQIELEAQERILVENNKALKQLAQNLGRIYAARKNASLTPYERLMNRLAAEQDPQKKIQLAKQAFSDDPMALTVLENIEPLDVEEFVSDNLGYGTLNWEGIERGEHHVRGLQEMMGRDKTRGIGRNSDTNGFNAFLAPSGQGLGFDEVVHSIWEAQPDQMDGGKAYDTQDISNALLGMLQSATKPTDISHRIVNNRIAEAEEVYNENIERMREEEQEAMREEEQEAMREEEQEAMREEEQKTDTFTGRLEQAKGETDTAPTEGQKKAGNYKLGHIEFGGYKMSIENPKGSVRSGVDAQGRPWSITMQDTYGYIGKKFGADGDHLDFFINDDADLDTWNGRVFIVDQKNEDGTFDEHKVMYGYNTWADAARAYQRNYEAGWWDKHVMQMMGVRKADFDKWLDDSDHKRKPFADYFRTKMLSDVVSDPVSDLLSNVDERRERIEQQEIGGAMVDRLEDMGFEVSTNPMENRRARKEAERDNSEVGKLRHFTTPDGKMYGFSYKGKIYLDPTKIDAELPIHEYAHPWCEALRRLNPDGWQNIVNLMKSDKDTWDFVKKLNPDITTDEDLAEEMIAHFSGKRGAERAWKEFERMNGRDSDYKSKWGNIWKNIAKAIQDFWRQVGDFLHIRYDSPEQVYDQVVKDFANNINPRKRVEKFLQERDDSYMQAVKARDLTKAKELFDEALRENIGNGIVPFLAVDGYRNLQKLAHGVKTRDPKVIAEVADLMAPLIPKDAVLVPAPSHTGKATDMLDLAQAIAERTGVPVADVLTSKERNSQYKAKKEGKTLSADELGIVASVESLPDGKLPVVIDNVVDSGNTAEACVKALGKGVVVSLADSADRYKHVASLKSAEPVITGKNGAVIPLSQRFVLGGSKYLGKAPSEPRQEIGMVSEASVIELGFSNQYGLKENTAAGREITAFKDQHKNTIVLQYNRDDKTFSALGNDAEIVREFVKGSFSEQDGVKKFTFAEAELDTLTPVGVRKGYKFAILQNIEEKSAEQPIANPEVKRAKITPVSRHPKVKSIMEGLLPFEEGTQQKIESKADDRSSIQKMNDRELLASLTSEDPNERSFLVDEYDRRHRKEYGQEVDRYTEMLDREGTSLDDAYDMYSGVSLEWNNGGFRSPERTKLMAQIDALENYVERLESERHERELEEEFEDNEKAKAYERQKTAIRERGYDLSQLKMRELGENESCHVERRYIENKGFSFTGSERIESAADVAYIFRELENAATENTFMVLIKDGSPTVIHLAIGSYNAAYAPIEQAFVGAQAINPDQVVFLHNHPSGNLEASKQDFIIQKRVEELFPGKAQPGIIIDTTSGKYAEFSTDFTQVSQRPEKVTGQELPVKVYSFSKQVFNEDWNPEDAYKGNTTKDVAAFVSSHRLGEHKKMSLLALDTAGHITGNIFLPWTRIEDAAKGENAQLIATYVNQMGGIRCIIYGNYKAEKKTDDSIRKLQKALESRNVYLIDALNIGRSAHEWGVMEPEATSVSESEAHEADTTIKSYFDKQPQRTEEQRVRVRATKAVLTAMSNAKVPYKVVSPEEEKQMLRLFSLMNKEAVKEFARRPSMRAKDKHGRGRYIVYNMQDPFGVPMYAEKLEVARWIKQGAKRYGGDWEILDIGEPGKEQTDGALKNAADMQTMIVRLGNGDDAKTIQFMIGDEADAAEQPMFQKEGKRILGWSDGKQVYLTQAGLNPNTPLHECTHMWDKWCQQVQPELWKRLVNALKKTAAWEELRQNPNYRNIWNDENRMASEVHSRLTGATGEDEFMKAAFKQSTPKKIINEVKSALRKFWEAVLRLFGKGRTISDDFDSLEAIVRMPIRDLVNEDFEKVMKVAEQDAVSSGDLALMDGEMLMKTLMGVHNISEEKLKKVIKQGGLANPSLAVFDTRNYTHTDYGEISLIPRSSMIDARTGKNAGTWTADAWTPTYPHTEKHMSDKGQDKFWSDLSKVENDEAVGGSDISSKLRLGFDSYLDGRDSAGMYWWYLYERGEKPEKVLFTTDKKQEDIDAYKAVMGDNDRYSDLDEAGQAKLLELVARDKGKTLEELHQDMQALKERNEKRAAAPGAKAFVKMNVKRINEEIDTYGVPYSYISDYVNAMNAAIRSAGKVNVAATFNQARETVKEKNLESDFGKWLEDKEKQYGIDEVIFTGYTQEGDRKYVKNTLANASRVMKQEGRNGAHGMGGIGLMIATVAKRVTSLDQIRKEKKNLSSTPEQHEAFREKWDNVMFGIAQQCGDGDLWTGEARLQEALGTKNPAAHLKNEYGISLPQEDVRQLNTFIDEVRKNYPTGYFETKFERPVGLEEFAVAVVPEATSPEVVEALKNAGLDVRTYNATGSEEQQRESRRIAVMDAVGMRNDILFHIEDDADTLERLDKEPTEKGYRNVVVNEDGTLGSPMANRLGRKGVGRKATTPFEFGKWERSDEHPELANENGKIDLIKPGNKEIGGVDYNPYIHIRPNKVNKQFKQAWERPNLIYVETEYPKSELEGGYHAEKAALSVGKHPWGGGELILSRWDKPVRMIPWEEVADDWEKEFAGRGVEFDIVPPALLPILAERGVEILPPHKGMGKACNEAYQAWKAKNAEQEKMYRHITPAENEANKEYNRQLDKYAVGEMKSHEEFNLGEPSPILRICGVTGKEIHMNQSVLKSHLEKHSLTINELKNIPSALYHPIMVYQWGDKARSHVIISELPTHDGRKVTVTIRVNNTGHVLDVEKITSVHGKDLEHLVKEINTEKSDFGKDNLKYVDKKKALQWLAMDPPKGSRQTNEGLNSAAKIINDFDSTKYFEEKISELFPEYVSAASDASELIGGEKVRFEVVAPEEGTLGWYDPNDNSVHVVIPNHSNAEEVKRTVFHEKLGHEGLVSLLGSQEEVNKFGQYIFKSASKELRRKMLGKADDEGYGWDDPLRFSKAAQEVFADIAADGPKTAEEFSLWTKVKHYLIKGLKKLGISVRGLLNDHDLSYYVLKTGEALKRWNKMSRSEKADVSAQTTQYDLMRSRDGRPRKRGNESMAQYLERLRAWEKWKIAEEQSVAAGDKQPDKNAIDQLYDEQYRADLEEWKRNNGIAEGADGPGAFPKREPNESPQDYALRVADYEQQTDVWHDAPSWLDYQQRAQREYREAYEAWKSRYDLAEADNVDMELYEGRGNEGPKTDEDVEVEARMEQALTQAVGVSLDGDGARRHAKLAVIERRKNLESSNAEDAIWLYQLKGKIDDYAEAQLIKEGAIKPIDFSRKDNTVIGNLNESVRFHRRKKIAQRAKELREALPYIIEGTYYEDILRDEDGNVVQIVDISDQVLFKKSPELDRLLDDIKDWYDEFYHVIEDAGLRNDAGYIPEGYVNHVWDKSKSNPSAWNKYIENRQRTKSPNMRHREIETYQQGIDVGLVPKYDDICDILAHYSRENNQAVANKKFLDDLSFLVVEETNEEGEVISALPLLDSKKPSFGEDRYAMYHVPGIGDVWVLKDVQKRFATIFGTMRTPDVSDWLSSAGRTYDVTSSTMKKIQLSFSGFHLLALSEVAAAQMIEHPIRMIKTFAKYIFWDSYVRQRTIPAYVHQEDFQFAAKHLVQLGATEDYAASDVNNLTATLRKKAIEWYHEENAGKKVVGAVATPLTYAFHYINQGMDKILWNYLHDGLKIACFKMFAEQIDDRVRKEGLSEQQREQLLDEAGQYVNDTFGGQYWELLNVSPGVLKWMRRAFLSPDWLISTQRHFFSNFGFGSLYSESGFLNYLRFNADNIKRAFGADIPRDEMRRFRSRNAKICYLIGVICMYYPMMNAINAYFRSKDEDEEKAKADEIRKTNPDYKSPYELAYPDGMKWYDYTMLGNSLGQQTHLFWGRYEDGTETYVRWGKQFREFPELFMGRHGVEFPTPLIERMMGKANPMLGLTRDGLGALGVWGFTTSNDIKEIQRKYGKEIGVLAMTAQHFLPFSIPTQADKEFKLIDLVMPSQKGFTRYKTIDFFKTYILAGDMEGVTRTYNAAVMNGIDAEKCLKAAITTIKATQRKEMQDGVVDLQTAMEKFDAAGENGESVFSTKAALRNKIVAYLAENEYRAFTRADALEQVNDFLEGNGVAEKDSEKYIELCKSTDVRDDYRLSAIDRKAKEYVDKVKTCEDEQERKKMAKQYAAWFAIKDISSKARSSINKLKKQLGQGRDEEVMNQIRDIRQKAQEAIDKVEAPK